MYQYEIRLSDEMFNLHTMQWLKEKGHVLFLIREEGGISESIHYHGIFKSNLGAPAIRSGLQYICNKKVLKKAQSQYRVAFIRDMDRYLRYMCKGYTGKKEDEVDVVINDLKIDVQAYHDRYHIINEDVKKAARDSVKSLNQMVERIIANIDMENVVDLKKEICGEICRYYRDRGKRVPRPLDMETLFNTILYDLKIKNVQHKFDLFDLLDTLYPRLFS